MKLSIVIPFYNEEETISHILKKVIGVRIPIEKEILCIDDGSKDNSASIIKRMIKENKKNDIRYFHKKNAGKGSAVRLGLQKASGDIFIIQDADLEYNPEDYGKLLKPILDKKFKAVYGSRYPRGGHLKKYHNLTYTIHKVGNHILSFITSLLYGQKITDMETCYKLFTREVYKNIKLSANDFRIEPEITAEILKKKYKIKEIPIEYYSRGFSEGKKITWKDGLLALFTLIKLRFSP